MFDNTKFTGMLIKGELREAVKYLKDFPEKKELYDRYLWVFENENYPIATENGFLNDILTAYRKYYRQVFYLKTEKKTAEENLRKELMSILKAEDSCETLEETEENHVKKAFESFGFHFLGGTTGGYFGPYIWTNEEIVSYAVELPKGTSEYAVKLLSGFISNGWLSFISFGETGTGGWTEEDGTVNCIKESYDLQGEAFNVSLLKHEAQHAEDKRKFKHISSEMLEYRAKLVELIYSKERNLLPVFISQADGTDPKNGHAMAAERIVKGFEEKLGTNRDQMGEISSEDVRETALKLFFEINS